MLVALGGPLGYGHRVTERLHRRAFASFAELDALCDAAAPPDAGMTGEELMQALAAMTPEQRARPIRGAQSGGWIVGVRDGGAVIWVDARYP